ncbi:MAG: right-handed parallel beta-helix repeat-containing protein, partial [Planctomycetota bacterium]
MLQSCVPALLATLATLPLGAAVIHVDPNAHGAGDGSSWANAHPNLDAALTAAAAGDTLWLAGGTYTPGTGSDRNARFTISTNVSIYGGFAGHENSIDERNPAAATIISGEINTSTRRDNIRTLLQITDATVSLHDLILERAHTSGANDDDAGALLAIRSDVQLNGCTLRDNRGPLPATLTAQASNLAITDTVFDRNRTGKSHGGAINASGDSSLLLQAVTFTNNRASAGHGGAIHLASGRGAVQIDDCIFSDNRAAWGGAIYNEHGGNDDQRSLILSASTFADNASSVAGGAVYLANFAASAASVAFDTCHFTGNEAGDGGGALFLSAMTTTISASTFSRNRAAWGGAIYNDLNATTLVHSSTLNHNQADDGGAIVNASGAAIAADTCLFKRNRAALGGSIAVYDHGLASISASTFERNDATYGGSVFLYPNAEVDLATSLLKRNSASYGAAVYNWGGQLRATTTTFKLGQANDGGAIIDDGGSTSVRDCHFNSNVADIGGGAIEAFNNGHLQATAATFKTNAATWDSGGAVAVYQASAVLAGCLFDRNSSYLGGAVVSYNNASSWASNCVFSKNSASFGGAWYSEYNTT